ncbi:hypothetical protein H9637_15420 [Clostridium sp. N37]|uniref:Uncharacterized protein n=2 Tax=Clostridium faecium TaxID=2762223 RepID=A0ABR8YW61_9CLOT|nr:hypothetical protein [Clostridium faecium]
MVVLLSNNVMLAQLEAIKWFVGILVGITITIIFAGSITSWKLSDIEIKNIEKYLQERIDSKFDELNKKLDKLTTITETTSSDGIVILNGWERKSGGIKYIRMSNAEIYQVNITVINSNINAVHDVLVIPKGLIEPGEYRALEINTLRWVTISLNEDGWITLVTPIKNNASLKIKLDGYSITNI